MHDCASRVRVGALIESLASTNARPFLVEHQGRDVPLFPPDHNWEEERRVAGVLAQLNSIESEALWEELVEHVDDKRHALTMAFDGGHAVNYTVGQLCWELAIGRLHAGAIVALEPNSDRRTHPYLDLGYEKDLKRWRRERARYSLLELQIQLCELSIKLAESSDKIPDWAKVNHRKRMTEIIDELRQTKKPYTGRMYLRAFDFYNAVFAARIYDELGLEPAAQIRR